MQWEIVTSEERFKEITKDWKGPVACDTETYGTDPKAGKLLGIALSGSGPIHCYIPFWTYNENGTWTFRASSTLISWLKTWMRDASLVGHNFTYDKQWLHQEGFETRWIADTRIMWHLASAPAGPRPYGLKDAQIELLGWEAKGDVELDQNVRAKGGKLSNGDHYLADLPILAQYACLDTYSTLLVYKRLSPFFDRHQYWPFLSQIMAYNELLELNTACGVAVDVQGLHKAHNRLIQARDAAMRRTNKLLKEPIAALEDYWKECKVVAYKSEHHRKLYLSQPHRWPKFNWNSDPQKRELFYDVLGNPVIYHTKGGKKGKKSKKGKLPSTNADAVSLMKGEWVKSYLKYEKANTLITGFTSGYIDSLRNSRLHPGFNICGTVSYRLSGFKPYLLNAPFEERLVMKNLKCDEGYTGVHADLSAIEPTITAHYSDDPSLLKVFRDGLGDIYLDLALEMFPDDKELQEGYNPNVPIIKAVKDRFERQRKIAKIVQLAVQYTGTEHTVQKNLMKAGVEVSLEEAETLVAAYWRKFAKVAQMNDRLRELNRHEGLLRNVIGRIIRAPDPEYKDLGNRFIQSSGHDVLVLWVLEIYRLCKERGIHIKPIILDTHDATSNQCPKEQAPLLIQAYKDALANINAMLSLSVTVKAEIKTFQTLAGLKADE